MSAGNDDEEFTPKEAQQRFQKLVKIALESPPKPIKSMGKKGVPAQSKKAQQDKRRKKSSAA